MKSKLITLSIFLVILSSLTGYAQNREKVQWISFEQLEDSLKIKPKKVLISFYADWCVYCKKMDRVVFTKPDIVKKLSEEYYVVKMNVETKDTIVFGGSIFTNKNHLTSRSPIHDIPILLASRKNHPLSLPATIIMDETFKVDKRFFTYMSPKRLLQVL
ncbi:thioredoxin family protein [Aquimarina algiphila]|uniref:thioredoxin family protein n=1 Tax=Aquimarina algiphila TaxID=2047982 RepID=UPI00232A95F0|nr:thioredoxin family protein [Aquimarina algiphila]